MLKVLTPWVVDRTCPHSRVTGDINARVRHTLASQSTCKCGGEFSSTRFVWVDAGSGGTWTVTGWKFITVQGIKLKSRSLFTRMKQLDKILQNRFGFYLL